MAASRNKTREIDSIEDIQRRMAEVRRDLRSDMREAVKGVEASLDWRSYFNRAPLAATAAAFVVGIVVAPARKSKALKAMQTPARTAAGAGEPRPAASAGERERSTLLGAAVGILAPIAIRAAQGYALRWVEGMIDRGFPKPPRPMKEPDASAGAATVRFAPKAAEPQRNRPRV